MNTLDKVAITSRSFSANKYLVEELRARYANITLNNSGKTLVGSELLEFLDGQNKVIVGLENFDKNLIDQLPELKVISKFGVGLNNIDQEAMKENSISLGFQPGTNKQSVAELALMHIFIALRKAPSSKEDICNNIWSQNKGHELFGKTIGIIGFGNIGQRLAELLEPFKCKIIFYDGMEYSKEELVDKFPSRSESFINNLQQSSLNEVLKVSDIISIHIPLLEETQNLISVDELACLKKDVRIINTSRGGIVDEKALEDFLNQNKNAFAAFDVFETEPNLPSELKTLENVVSFPHLGSATIETRIAMGDTAINNALAFFEGKDLPNKVV